MDLMPYVSQLRDDLTAAASAGDEQTRHTAAMLSVAVEPAARLAIMNALSDLAAEVTAALEDRVVEVRLDGRDVRVAVSSPSDDGAHSAGHGAAGHSAAGHSNAGAWTTGAWPGGDGSPPTEPGASPFGDAGGDIRRMTLRLIDQLKTQAERAAAEQGVSLNTWVSQAVAGALRGEPWNSPRGAPGDRRNRVQGWVQG
ncbi:MAG: toxin-antitoxin system HicB family antitoxin [Pseudonocardiaceae bacterium]